MKQCLKIAGALAVSYLLCVSPLFPYSGRDIIGMQGPASGHSLFEASRQEVLVPGPFEHEFARAGKIWNPPPDIEMPEESAVQEYMPEPEDTAHTGSGPVYVSAGPDCYGFAGSPIYIGTEKDVPDSMSLMWRQTEGFPVFVEDPEAACTFFVPGSAGVYVFALDITGPDGSVRTDSVQALVDEKEGNHVPAAFAGSDIAAEFYPDTWITLEGKGCDADNDMLDFAWRQTGGPEASLFGGDTDTLDVMPLSEGIYTFELTVNDGMTDSLPDEVSVNCFAPGNEPPVVSAEDVNVPWKGVPCRVELDGSLSYDPEGAPLSFEWEQTDGPPVVLDEPFSDTPEFFCTEQGHYWFTLQVDDGQTPAVPAEVSVTVMPEPAVEEDFSGGGCRPGKEGSSGAGAAFAVMVCMVGAALAGKMKSITNIQ